MFITDLKSDFYNVLIGKRILVIVNYDIDGICASKILQSLFQYGHMQYTVVSTMGLSGMARAFQEHQDDIKFVVLINCGGCIDLVEVLQPAEDVVFFVCDSHRPMDVCNIYSDSQVRILGEINSNEQIPQFSDLFNETDDENDTDGDDEDVIDGGAEDNERDDDDDNDDDGENSGNVQQEQSSSTNRQKKTRMEKLEERQLRLMKKRNWEEKRNKIIFEYTQYSFYGRSSAVQLFELAWKLSKDSLDLLWWAIVGITEQLVLGKLESGTYFTETEQIQSHVLRLTNKTSSSCSSSGNHDSQTSLSSSSSSSSSAQTALKINFEKNELHLALYRHWTVIDSIKHSMYPACRLKLWTLRGEKKLHELLVEMGLPLVQAKQQFIGMDLILRKEFGQMIEKYAEKYQIPEIIFSSFNLQYGYRNRYCASDYVYSLLAILESIRKDRSPEFCFYEALDSLSRTNKQLLDSGVERAKEFLTAIFRQVQTSLEMHQVKSAGPFLYFILPEENSYFSCPYGLTMLAKFLLNGYVAVTRNHQRAQQLPFVASCPVDEERGVCLMIGIAPVCEDSGKNFFGKAFEQAAMKSSSTIAQDFFETSIIQIMQSDIMKFLDGLTVLLS